MMPVLLDSSPFYFIKAQPCNIEKIMQEIVRLFLNA